MIFYFFFNKNFRINNKKIFLFFLIPTIIYLSYSYSMKFFFDATVPEKVLYTFASQIVADIPTIRDNIFWALYFASVLLPIAFVSLFRTKIKNNFYFFFSTFFILTFLLLFTNISIRRASMLIAFPAVFLTASFLKGRSEYTRNILFIILIALACVNLFVIMQTTQNTTIEELNFLKSMDIPDNSILVVTNRINYLVKWLVNDSYDVRTAEYWAIWGGWDKTNNSLLFNSSSLYETRFAIENLKEENGVNNFYVYFNIDLDAYENRTINDLTGKLGVIVNNSSSGYLVIV